MRENASRSRSAATLTATGSATLLDTLAGCAAPSGYVADATDCDDAASDVHPGAVEVCDGADQNCNGQVDEGVQLTFCRGNCRDSDGDGHGSPASPSCSHPTAECDDANAGVNPGATEIPSNGIDDDCNAATPGGCSQP